MTVSESNLSDTWDRLEWYALSHESVRSDVTTLLKYRDGFDSISPVYLFWELYRPSLLHDDGSKSSAPKLPGEVKDLVLKLLHDMYQRHHVPYVPDQGFSDIREYFRASEESEFEDTGLAFPSNLKNLLILIHVASARAFLLKQDSGFSEEVVDCLNQVERCWQQISLNGYTGSSTGHEADFYEVFHSIDAISALALVEFALLDRNQGIYAESLHKMAEAEDRYTNSAVLVMGPVDRWPVSDNATDLPPPAMIHEFLTGMHTPAEYALETFNLLKESRYEGAWAKVARDCERLAGASFLSFPSDPAVLEEDDKDEDEHGAYWEISEEYVWPEEHRWAGGVMAGDYWEISQALMDRTLIPDGQSNTVTWHRFWLMAQGWASAQLSRSEYRKMREDDEKDAAETRLKNYFFGSTWSSLPERAQESLISADSTWNSLGRVRRESILNELLRATEEMCERFVFQPLMNEESTKSSILSIEAKVADRHRSLGVREHIEICELPSLPSLLTEHSLDDGEIRFLTEDLPASMRNLARARNPAEHDTGASVLPALVDSAYRLFLGIGREGVLPRLARIGRKLQSHRP